MSKFLSLDWFKEKIDHSIERVIERKLDSLIEQDENCVKQDNRIQNSPYLHMKMVNSVLTVVLNDGSVLSKPNATENDFNYVKKASSEEQIIRIIGCTNVIQETIELRKEQMRDEVLLKGVDILKQHDDFVVEDNVVRFKKTSRSIPPLLVEKFSEVLVRCKDEGIDYNEDVEYLSLKRFFLWCCLNPRAEVAKELYRFLTDNSFRITKQGFFVALRNVVSLEGQHGSNERVQFISNAYNKIKGVWKKNPKDYDVIQLNNGTFKFQKSDTSSQNGTLVGNLHKLYVNLPEMTENRFTDDWTRTFDIRIGKVVSMPMEECNWSTQDCAAAGLHFTADQIHYVGCGDTSVLMLINPMKVVGIGSAKGRCYEYLPIMTVPKDEATRILHDLSFDTLELDEDFTIRELESLAEKAQDGFIAESGKHQFNLPSISTKEIKNIVKSLSEMSEMIQKRVVNLD
jgi:hypothetical protein